MTNRRLAWIGLLYIGTILFFAILYSLAVPNDFLHSSIRAEESFQEQADSASDMIQSRMNEAFIETLELGDGDLTAGTRNFLPPT